jgi:tetratricopeptide (TPR) repeat protein
VDSTTPKPIRSNLGGAPINQSIVWVTQANLRIVIRQELKKVGIVDAVVPADLGEAITNLQKYDDALLIIDQGHSLEDINCVLKAAQGQDPILTRPIFFMAQEITDAIVSVCSEYNVSRIHPGQVSRDELFLHLSAIVDQESEINNLRHSLIEARDLMVSEDYKAATKTLSNLYKKYPQNMRILCDLAECLIQRDSWSAAEDLLVDPMKKYPEHLRVQNQYARCLMQRGRFDEASRVLQSCNLINPFKVDRLIQLGHTLIETDRVKEALNSFDEALDLEPENRAAKMGVGQCNLLLGEVNTGLDLLRQISSPREMASIFNNSAILSVARGRLLEGMRLYRTAMGALDEEGPAKAKLVFNLGLAYHKANKETQAKACFARACEMDSSLKKSEDNLRILSKRDREEITEEEGKQFKQAI